MNYYIVDAVCGHVGRGKGIVKSFSVVADSASEASAKCRFIPRVKHHNKKAIQSVKKVDFCEYMNQRIRNDEDPFFKAHNRTESYMMNVDYSDVLRMSCFGRGSNRIKEEDEEDIIYHMSRKKYETRYKDNYRKEEYMYEVG